MAREVRSILHRAYKSDVDDMRESPTFALMDGFKKLGARIDYHDPHVPIIGSTREHKEWQGRKSVAWTREILDGYDAVVIATHHKAFDLQELADTADLVIDTRNAMTGIAGSATLVKA